MTANEKVSCMGSFQIGETKVAHTRYYELMFKDEEKPRVVKHCGYSSNSIEFGYIDDRFVCVANTYNRFHVYNDDVHKLIVSAKEIFPEANKDTKDKLKKFIFDLIAHTELFLERFENAGESPGEFHRLELEHKIFTKFWELPKEKEKRALWELWSGNSAVYISEDMKNELSGTVELGFDILSEIKERMAKTNLEL